MEGRFPPGSRPPLNSAEPFYCKCSIFVGVELALFDLICSQFILGEIGKVTHVGAVRVIRSRQAVFRCRDLDHHAGIGQLDLHRYFLEV